MEFEAIPKRREMARYDCALMDENTMKNSDPNFLPYDDNRVRLTPTMENRHGYVNASNISVSVDFILPSAFNKFINYNVSLLYLFRLLLAINNVFI